jgi:outer membrane lipoprotein SlyB
MQKLAFILPVALFALAGCDQPIETGYVSSGQVSQNQTVQYGTIVGVRTVRLQGGNGDLVAGAVAGGIAGAVVGNQFGKGSGNAVMTGAGAVGGAMLGSQMAGGPSYRTSQQWTVRLDNGAMIDVIQGNGQFRIGQHVQIVQNGNGAYLAP